MSLLLSETLAELTSLGKVRDLYEGDGLELYATLASDDLSEVSSISQVLAKIGKPCVVCEYGCGDGRLLFSLDRKLIATYIGLDSSGAMLSKLKTLAADRGFSPRRVNCIQVDVAEYHPRVAEADLVILGAGSIRLFDEDERNRIYQSIRTQLTKAGYLYISTASSKDLGDALFYLGSIELETGRVRASFFERELDLGDRRETGFLVQRKREDSAMRDTCAYTSVIYNIGEDQLRDELIANGFSIERVDREESAPLSGKKQVCVSFTARKG